MMLAFFIICFFGIYWMHAHYAGRQQAMLRARSCAWVYAAGGCEDKAGLTKCLADDGGRTAREAKDHGVADDPQSGDDFKTAGGKASGKWPNASSDQTSGQDDPNADPDQQGPPAQAGGSLGGSKVTGVLGKLEGIPLLGPAIRWLFGKPVSVDATQPVYDVRTPAFHGDTVNIVLAGDYHTLCNSKPESWKTLAHDIFCNFVGSFPGCK
jgi:hypothetical protein